GGLLLSLLLRSHPCLLVASGRRLPSPRVSDPRPLSQVAACRSAFGAIALSAAPTVGYRLPSGGSVPPFRSLAPRQRHRRKPMYDYIIVGAGSAGCVLANRLSADPDTRVLLLEAGPRDWHPFIHMPAGIAKLVNRKGVNWDYNTDAEPHLNGRRLWWPRGKVLGGSSSINAMCYVRGNRRDYDEWAALGAPGWSWDDCLPWFRKAENNQRGANAFHGVGGPLSVSDLRHHNPLSEVFLSATREAGFPQNDDFNGATQAGFGYYQVTQKDGARCSSAVAYLDPVRDRKNLKVITGAQVTRLKIENGRVSAVHYQHNGKPCCEGVEREVLLAGGALNSPQLLMLSGIGPAQHLREHGLEVLADLPGVGANLQDHLDVCTLQRCLQNVTYDRVSDVAVAFNYYLFRRHVTDAV